MKKIITLMLLLGGFTYIASAGKLYINLSNPGWWGNLDASTAISFDGGTTKTDMTIIYMYGGKWAVSDIPSTYSSVKIWRRVGDTYYDDREVTISSTNDQYQNMYDGTLSNISSPRWNHLVFRQNIIDWEGNNGNTWNDNDMHNTTHPDGDTFTFELTKTQIDNSSNKAQGIRFRLRNSDKVYYNDAGTYINDFPQLYPTAPTLDNGEGKTYGEKLNIGASTTTYYHNTDATYYYWQVDIPSYNYEKIVITAKYVNESGYKWKISADAYISKTIGPTGYATFSSIDNLDVDFTNVVGLTANKGKVQSDGTIKWTEAGALYRGEGVLLHGAQGSYSIPVASSASADTDNNDFVAIQTDLKIYQTMDGKKAYLLAKPEDKPLGFYKPYSDGTSCSAGTAYLKTTYGPAAAREYFPLWDESANIDEVLNTNNVNSTYYNLAGQQVSQPTKGLYIVNGKKVVIR